MTRAGALSRAQTTGGRLVVDALLMHEVDTLFCVPGESYLPVLDALYDEKDRVRLVSCRHSDDSSQLLDRPASILHSIQSTLLTRLLAHSSHMPTTPISTISVTSAPIASLVPPPRYTGQRTARKLARSSSSSPDPFSASS